MKKLLGILVLGLLWCSTANAITLEKCYVDSISNVPKYKAKREFNEKRYEKNYFKISASQGTVTKVFIFTEAEFKKRKKREEEFNKEYPDVANIVSNKKINTKIWQITFADENLIVAESRYEIPASKITFGFAEFIYNKVTVDIEKAQVNVFRESFYSDGEKIKEYTTTHQCNFKGESGETAGTSGTAFFINNKGNLLTNNHVVEGCEVSKINYFNKEYETNLIATDKMLDLALLKVDLKPKSFISFSNKEPKKRQLVVVAGYPLGEYLSDDLKINEGKISSLKGFENNSNEITVDLAINPGNSGGPIVDENGQLVAVAVAGMSKEVTEGISFGIKSSAVSNFLKSNKISPDIKLTSFSMNDEKVNQLLEESTVYTFCN